MPSIPKFSAAGKPFPLCFAPLLFLLFLLLSSSSVQGASLREHRLRGSESEPQRANPHQAPNADMLKALEYIESLRQRAGTGPQQQTPLTPEYDASHLDETKKLRAILRLASPAQSKGQAEQNGKEEEEEEGGEGNEEEKTQEWLQAVLSTLQQTEKASKPASLRPNTAHLSLAEGGRPVVDEKDSMYPWVQQHGVKPYEKHPLMFEDDEEGEGDEEEEKEQEGTALDHKNPFKRTNENVEEKYTPQNLATLQSVFEELGRLANTKATHKRQAVEDDEEVDDEVEDDDDDDDDMFNVRNLAYEDVAGGLPDWAPLEEQEEEDEDERDNKYEVDQGLDYGNDGEEEDDDNDDMENDEEDDESYPVKRASNSSPREDPDDIANLVDYYLLKVLEKTEEEEQKRELEEEKQRAERRVVQSKYRNNIDPQAIYQLIQISQKFQIPPEDLVDMLKTGELTNQDKTPLRSQAPSRKSNELARIEDTLSQISSNKKHMSPEAQLYNRRLPDRKTSSTPEDKRTEEILSILGLGDVGNQDQAPLRKQKQHKNSQSQIYTQPGGPSGESSPTQWRLPDKLKDDYDDTVDEDELAAYLAAQILAQYPNPVHNKNKVAQKRNEGGQTMPGSFEQAIQDYFDQMDSDKSPPQKRQSETEGMGGTTQTQRLDDEALMMKLLSYLNPETQESDDDDADAKSVQGM